MSKVSFKITDVQRAVKAARQAGIGDRLTVSIKPDGEIKIAPFIEEQKTKDEVEEWFNAQN